VTEEAAKTIEKPHGKIPDGYVLETIFRKNNKSFELWHEPKVGHYIEHEVGTKW